LKLAAFDVETSGELPEYALQPWRVRQGKAWLTSLAWVWRQDSETRYAGGLRPDVKMICDMLAWAHETGHILVGWNVVFDLAWLYAYADDEVIRLLDRVRFLDAMLLWRHLDIEPEYEHAAGRARSYSLKAAVPIFFPKYAGYEADIDLRGSADDPVKAQELHEYNIKDCVFTLRLARRFWRGLSHAQQTVAITEAASFKMVARANLEGLIVDTLEASNLSANLKDKAAALLASLAPHGITEKIVRSPTQLGKVLFDQWKLPSASVTASGARSTAKAVLYKLALQDPRVKSIKEYREALNNNTKFAVAPLKACAYNQDGRAHPQARVFGTYCVPGDVEVLTRAGWVRLDQWPGGDIMQVRPDRSMEFLPAEPHTAGVNEDWIEVRKLKCRFTPQHTMPYLKQKTFTWATETADQWIEGDTIRHAPVAGYAHLTGQYTSNQMRLFAAVQADGSYVCKKYKEHTYAPTLKFTFKKQRKIDRIKLLLAACGITYREYSTPAYLGRVEITVAMSNVPKWLGRDKKFLGPWLLDTTQEGLAAFVDELVHWDGSRHADGNAVKYSSFVRDNLIWAMTTAALVGKKASMHKAASHTIHVSDGAAYRDVRTRESYVVHRPAKAFCPMTQTGFWLAKSRDRIFITGNSARMTFSSKQGKNKDTRQIGFALHQMKRDVTFRRIIVPPQGYALMEFDAAGQEYRWMAIVSGDETMLKLCQPGEDPHAYMGSRINRMFTYKQIQKNAKIAGSPEANLRQCGKVVNLSSQYRVGYKKLQQIAEVDYNISLSLEEAHRIQRVYLATYPGVLKYWATQINSARLNGYVTTIPGRHVRVVGEWGSSTGWQMEGTAINYPVQGTGAEQKYLALRCVREYINAVGARFAFDLHDGLYFYVPVSKTREVAHHVKDLLDNLPYEAVWKFKPPIPMPWDCKVGASWGDLQPFQFT
jgi:DNA polymerase I-like protein with 3'-5' exonuclease and polymerase domains